MLKSDIPFAIIIGQKEVDDNMISYRKYGTEETITVSKEEFISLLKNIENEKK